MDLDHEIEYLEAQAEDDAYYASLEAAYEQAGRGTPEEAAYFEHRCSTDTDRPGNDAHTNAARSGFRWDVV
jgi:hypothetical protein